MNTDQTSAGATLTARVVPDERTRASAFIKRAARDEADEALLRDVVLDEQPTVISAQPEKAPATATPKADTSRAKRRSSRRTVMVDAGRAREHVRDLIERGMTLAAISRAADVSPTAVYRLLHGPSTTRSQGSIHVRREAQILAVQYAPPPVPSRCAQGRPFKPLGYHVGRCADCGQLAPHRDGRLWAHPHPKEREA